MVIDIRLESQFREDWLRVDQRDKTRGKFIDSNIVCQHCRVIVISAFCSTLICLARFWE